MVQLYILNRFNKCDSLNGTLLEGNAYSLRYTHSDLGHLFGMPMTFYVRFFSSSHIYAWSHQRSQTIAINFDVMTLCVIKIKGNFFQGFGNAYGIAQGTSF